MNILILSATAFELNSVKEKIKNEIKNKIKSEKNFIFNFSFFCTWIWNFEVILNLTKYLENLEEDKKPDFVINLWICWYQNLEWENEKFKNLVQVWRIFWTAKEKEFLIPQFINFWEISSIYSSEKIILNPEKICKKNINQNINFVEMESFWIEYILEKKWIPRIYLKFPFDKIWWEKTWENKTINFKEKLPEIKKILQENIDYKKLFQKIEKFLEKNSKKKFDKKFFQEFEIINKQWLSISFQNKKNLKHLFFKYEVLTWKKILKFLENLIMDLKIFWKWWEKFLIKKINLEIEKFL